MWRVVVFVLQVVRLDWGAHGDVVHNRLGNLDMQIKCRFVDFYIVGGCGLEKWRLGDTDP